MKYLMLMRHAKSDWSFDRADHDRPLNPRGRQAAPALGAWLRSTGHLPDQVLCSTAARTRETLDLLQLQSRACFERALYLAPPDQMLGILRAARGDRVLMLGHNPGIGQLAQDLLATAPDHPRFAAYPTGATLVVRFAVDTWADVLPGSGEHIDFVVPRELPINH
jgi:phosphohistidine phosphatase